MTWTTNDLTFMGMFTPPSTEVFAVAGDGARQWAGGHRLYDMAAGGNPVDPFDDAVGDDLTIRDLAVYAAAGELWLATDGNGVARVNLNSGALIDHFTATDTGLEGDKIRAIAVEQAGPFAGDVWAATDKGVARFKRDRGVWLTYGNSQGLQGRLDVNGIAIDADGGRRGVWAGSKGGLVYLVAE
jgi:ligand-binding sensor domain-containing protein